MKRLRICLIKVGLPNFNNYWMVPPMGILSLGAYIREKLSADVMLINQLLEEWTADEIATRLSAFECDVLGLSLTTPSAYLANDIIRAVRAVRPGVFVVLGGPHVSAVSSNVLDSIAADAAIAGEGELSFEHLLRERFDGGDLAHVPGLIWRSDAETVITNPGHSPMVTDLDTLPMPAYDLIDLPRYWRRQSHAPIFRRRYASLVTSRGCPFRCAYCHNIFGKEIRMQSAERIIEDVTWLQQRYGVNDFEFNDDTFNYDAERVLRFSQLIKSRNLNIRFAVPNGIRGDILTQEVVDAMVDAGLYHGMIALESGSPRIQKLMQKNLDLGRFLNGCDMMSKKHVYIHTACMLGFPTETEEELQQTIDVACAAHNHTASFFLVTPFPGTRLYEMVQKMHPEKLVGVDYTDATLNTIKVNLTDLPDDVLFEYQRKANRKYYLNPTRVVRLLRDHPQPWALPLYVPIFLSRVMRGLFS